MAAVFCCSSSTVSLCHSNPVSSDEELSHTSLMLCTRPLLIFLCIAPERAPKCQSVFCVVYLSVSRQQSALETNLNTTAITFTFLVIIFSVQATQQSTRHLFHPFSVVCTWFSCCTHDHPCPQRLMPSSNLARAQAAGKDVDIVQWQQLQEQQQLQH
jgi:hypothetical protein